MEKRLLDLYRRFRKAGIGGIVGQDAANCLDAARTVMEWEEVESAGLVRIESRPDDSYDPTDEDLEENSRYRRDGAWGIVGQYFFDGKWVSADSVWGCVGYNDPGCPFDNPYVIDIMAETLEAFKTEGALPHLSL